MSSDYIFRNVAFGGFNKDDVIQYIKSMKKNEADAKAEKAELIRQIEALKASNAELTESLTHAESESAKLKEENAEIKTTYEAKLSETEELHTAQMNALISEYEEKIRCCAISDKSVQEAVGTAMLDVRRYADMLLQETCDKVNTISANADDAAAKTLTRVLDISSAIRLFTERFNAIMNDITAENDRICRDITSFKGSLRLPFETAVEKLDSEILTDNN